MKVIRISESEANDVSSNPLMRGNVKAQTLVNKDMANELELGMITFSPGARNIFHSHDREQVLYITDGKGIVATETEEVTATPGMLFYIPAGEKHWHGATDDSSFSHVSIIVAPCKTEF